MEKLEHSWYMHHHFLEPALKNLFDSITTGSRKHSSQSSTASKMLKDVQGEFLREWQSLTDGSDTQIPPKMLGNVIICKVHVKCTNNQLKVNIEDTRDWEGFLRNSSENSIKVILIQSKSLHVIEAKLRVYREFQHEIDSGNFVLLHVLDDYEEVAKLSSYHTVNSFCNFIYFLRKILRIEHLDHILKMAFDNVLTRKQDTDDGVSVTNGSTPETYKSEDNGDVIEIAQATKNIGENISFIISTQMKNHFLGKTHNTCQSFSDYPLCIELFCLVREILKRVVDSCLTNMTCHKGKTNDLFHDSIRETAVPIQKTMSTFDWRKKETKEVLETLSSKQSEIILATEKKLNETESELKTFSDSLRKFQHTIKMLDQKTMVETWQKREVIEDRTLEKYQSVLRYIAGVKNEKPFVKVYLKYEDKTAMDVFEKHPLLKDTLVEFVNITTLAKENKNIPKTVNNTKIAMCKDVRDKLNKIISSRAEIIYANYSNVVGMGISDVRFEGDKMFEEPCIVVHCLDKTLIPYGEKQLPLSIDGYPCDIRESIFMFGSCVDCRNRYPDPGCSISRPYEKDIGSAGFLVKNTTTTGFLTAAHVAMEDLEDLYNSELYLSECKKRASSDYDFARKQHNIVHPAWLQNEENIVIGEVRESFIGNCSDKIGIDAAFVKTSEERLGEKNEMKIAEEDSLTVDGETRVTKRGQTTHITYGKLVETNFTITIPKTSRKERYCFINCYRIENEDDKKSFFEPGDSGSGVFMIDKDNGQFKPLGIAFASDPITKSTVVCKIEPIIRAFKLSLYKEDDVMDEG